MRTEERHKLEAFLLEEKARGEAATGVSAPVYCLARDHEKPNTFFILFVINYSIRAEYFTVTPDGFHFRRKLWPSVDAMLGEFKRDPHGGAKLAPKHAITQAAERAALPPPVQQVQRPQLMPPSYGGGGYGPPPMAANAPPPPRMPLPGPPMPAGGYGGPMPPAAVAAAGGGGGGYQQQQPPQQQRSMAGMPGPPPMRNYPPAGPAGYGMPPSVLPPPPGNPGYNSQPWAQQPGAMAPYQQGPMPSSGYARNGAPPAGPYPGYPPNAGYAR